MNPPGLKVTVLGLGISGYQSALFLKSRGFEVFVSDAGSSELVRAREKQLQSAGIRVETGAHTLEKVAQSDWVLISPGIQPHSAVYRHVKSLGIPVYSEIEVASWYCKTPRIVAVTGSAGKTTVVTLLSRALAQTGRRVVTCGNIGNPWIGEIDASSPEDIVVLEISSFQLAHCQSFRPYVGVLLNISPNHQDWHPDIQDYVAAKLNIFSQQNSADWAFLRHDDETGFFPNFRFNAKKVYFGSDASVNPNEDAVFKVCELFDVHSAQVHAVLTAFEGIEHRLERFAFSGEVSFVNDSKCTTTASLRWALEKMADKSVLLIAGGHPKSDDFSAAAEVMRKKVKRVYLIGEAIPLMRKSWKGICPAEEMNGFSEAVRAACLSAQRGDTVLLSPACASFDMFRNYEERGKTFKKLVSEYLSTSVPVR